MLILVNTEFLYAQQDTVKLVRQATNSRHPLAPFWIFKKKNWYKIQLQEMSGTKAEGYFTNITDDEVFYASEKTEFGQNNKNANKLSYADLDVVNIQRKGATARSTAIGSGIGAVLGSVVGYLSYNKNESEDPFAPLTALFNGAKVGMFGALIGAIAGLVIGTAAEQTFIIGGKKEQHKQMKFDVLQKIYGTPPATVN